MGKGLKIQATQVLTGIILTVLPLVYFWVTDASWNPLNPYDHLIQNGLAYLFLLLFSYFNHRVFVPRWFLHKRYGRYALIALGCLFAGVYLPYRIEQWAFFKSPQQQTPLAWTRQIFVEEMMLKRPSGPPSPTHATEDARFSGPAPVPGVLPQPGNPPPARPHPHGPPSMLRLPVKLALFFLLGSVSTLLSISVLTANRLHRVENDQLQAELRQLKAQIQPHFLFNTLNSIYALAIRQDERTADTIVKLSEFMRYIIRDAHRDKVAVAQEINYITNYIDLQKARLREAVQVDYQREGSGNQLEIAPLLLFSFVENAFKYGVSPDEASRIDIHIRLQEDNLSLYVANKKVQVSPFEESTGIGLQNTKERLRLLYPDAHQLSIDDSPHDFRVHLSLRLA